MADNPNQIPLAGARAAGPVEEFMSPMEQKFASYHRARAEAEARGLEFPPPPKRHVPVPIYLFMADPASHVEQPPVETLIEFLRLSPVPDHVGAGTRRVQRRTNAVGDKTYLVWTDNREHKEFGVAFLIKDEWQWDLLNSEVPRMFPGFVLKSGLLLHINEDIKLGKILVWGGEVEGGGDEV